jgi:hypothetical protein
MLTEPEAKPPPDWMEIFGALPADRPGRRWYVQWCDPDGRLIVDNCPTANAALRSAHSWGLPVVVEQVQGRAH